MRPTTCRILALVLLAFAGGCYHYVPEPPGPIPQGTPIRLHLSRPQSFEMMTITAHNIGQVTGEMIREESGEVVFSALWLDAVTGEGFDGGGWTFRVPRSDVTQLSVRRLSTWRTFAVLAMGAAATWLGFDALRGSDAGSGQSGGGGSPR